MESEDAWRNDSIKAKENYTSKQIWAGRTPRIWGEPWSYLQPTTVINGTLIAYHRKMDRRWWRAQAVRYLLRFQTEYTCRLLNVARHAAFGKQAANMVVKNFEGEWSKDVTVNERSDIEEFVWSNHKPWMPRPLLSMHVRKGDKACEMKVVEFEDYMSLADRIRKRFPQLNSVWLSTEMQEVIDKSRGYPHWNFYYTNVTRQVGNMTMATYETSLGRETSTNYPLVNFLMATEADFFIGALGSTWCFLIDGMRNTGGKVMAGYLSVNKDRFCLARLASPVSSRLVSPLLSSPRLSLRLASPLLARLLLTSPHPSRFKSKTTKLYLKNNSTRSALVEDGWRPSKSITGHYTRANWANLPEHLLDSVSERLLSSSNYLRFSAVCTSWFGVAKYNQSQHRNHPEPPMLLFFNEKEDAWSLYNVIENKVIEDLQFRLPNKRFCGSAYGWLCNWEDLLMVARLCNWEDLTKMSLCFTTEFKVYRFNFNKCLWFEKDTLGDDVAIFIGEHQSICVAASNFPGWWFGYRCWPLQIRFRMESLQQSLHGRDDCQTQRKLQLRIDEQAKYLKKIFEQQRKMEDNRVKPTSSTSDEQYELGTGTPMDEGSQDASMKQKAQESVTRGNHDPPVDETH
ncbi:hypothetical protein ACLB2K_064734 [Fragaria x ananassa]